MQKHLKNTDAKPVSASHEAGSVQVKSVSSTGNIKIALKSTQQSPAKAAGSAKSENKAKQSKVVTSAVQKTDAATSKAAPKITKPSKGMTPQSLASASAQGEKSFGMAATAKSGSSLKPLGLAAAALGVVALGLGVLQFAGGKSEAVAQGDARQTPEATPAPSAQVAAGAPSQFDPETVITKVQPVVAPVDIAQAEAKAPGTPDTPHSKTVVAEIIEPAVEPDKAAVVAPQPTSVNPTVIAEAQTVDPMKQAIADAMAKLGGGGSKSAVTDPVQTSEGSAPAKLKFDTTSLFKADPKQVAAFTAQAKDAKPAAVSETEAAPQVPQRHVEALASSIATEPNADLMARMTAGTLQALRSQSAQTGQAAPSEAETKAAVSDLYRLISEATSAGKSEAQIAVSLVEAHASGAIQVPQGFILPDGQVDTQTILSLFIAN